MTVAHPFPPLYDERSRILILGSFPSVKSREQRFFYGHPQNRFWRVIATIFGDAVPQSIPEKRALLLAHHIALWDVIAQCEITGSSDASIRNVIPNDLSPILRTAPITQIYTNGTTAYRLFCRYQKPILGREAILLPSTSPANAAMCADALIDKWRIVNIPLSERNLR